VRITIQGTPGLTLLECARRAVSGEPAAHLSAPCGGRGRCGKCRVRVLGSDLGPDTKLGARKTGRGSGASAGASCLEPPGPEETAFLSSHDLSAGIRLSCRAAFRTAGTVTVELYEERISAFSAELAAFLHPADRTASGPAGPLGIAVDIGTTTVVAVLLDTGTGTPLGSVSEANRQRSWGADVISRIEAAGKDPEALCAMSGLITGQLRGMMKTLFAQAGAASDLLHRIWVCGNTTMLHLFTGCDPSGLGTLPFRPAFLGPRTLSAREFGFPVPDRCTIELLPGLSAFVGADTVAGILATGLHEAREPELLVDIGTNGEIVLATEGGIAATATAAGPAFEGAHVACGSPGVPGAVDHAGLDRDGFWFTTIDGAPASGICGSGLLDILAALRVSGTLEASGRLACADGPDGMPRFYLSEGRELFVTQRDIRQLQLAKGAVAAGIRLLCEKEGVPLEAIRRVHLAGGFGTYMNPVSAVAVGLLPTELAGKIRAAGNTALRGVVRAALSADAASRCAEFASRARVLSLASEPGFQDAFMESMLFPDDETVRSLVPAGRPGNIPQ
jgi:uncharacterized 2Fe-2S/4Fe-4S cluster protein (DUF4445 family)